MHLLLPSAAIRGLAILALPVPPTSPASTPRDVLRPGESVRIQLTEGDRAEGAEFPSHELDIAVDFEGFVSIWSSSSELDPYLRIDVPGGQQARDEDSGGGTTAWCLIEVEPGFELRVRVGDELDRTGVLSVHTATTRESPATREAALEARRRVAVASHVRSQGGVQAARDFVARSIDEMLELPGGEDSFYLARALWTLAEAAHEFGDARSLRAAVERTLAVWERVLPAEHPDVQLARLNHAIALQNLGDLAGALALGERVVSDLERVSPADDPALQQARLNLSVTLKQIGKLERARALEQAVLDVFERTLPEDHPDLLLVRQNYAVTLREQGDLDGARELQEGILETLSQSLPTDHPDVTRVRTNLAITLRGLGETVRARELLEDVLEVQQRTLPTGHPEIQATRLNLSNLLMDGGAPYPAREILRDALDAYVQELPADHPEVLKTRWNLALAQRALGELGEARAELVEAAGVFERTLPEGHPDRVGVRRELAATAFAAGDLFLALHLDRAALDEALRTRPEHDGEIQYARLDLADVLRALGRLDEVLRLELAAMDGLAHERRDDDPLLQRARLRAGRTLRELGQAEGARPLVDFVLAVYGRAPGAEAAELLEARLEHGRVLRAAGDQDAALELGLATARSLDSERVEEDPELLAARVELAATRLARDETKAGRAILEDVVAILGRTVPVDHPTLLRTRFELLRTLEEPDRLAAVGTAVAEGIERGLARAVGVLDPLAVDRRAAVLDERLSELLSFAVANGDDALTRRSLALAWTLRTVPFRAARLTRILDGDAPGRRLAAEVRRACGLLDVEAALSWTADPGELFRLRRRLDKAADRLLDRLASGHETGELVRPVTLADITPPAGSGRAFVGWWSYEQRARGGSNRARAKRVLALVLRPEAAPVVRELATTQAVRGAVQRWRDAIAGGDVGAEREAGEVLRALVVDPLLADLEHVRTLDVALDDVLWAVPIDALPWGEKRLGDRWSIRVRAGAGPGGRPSEPPSDAGRPVLLALGDPALSGEDPGPADRARAVASAAPAVEVVRPAQGFASEIALASGLAGLERLPPDLERHLVVIRGARATEAELSSWAPRARLALLTTPAWTATALGGAGLPRVRAGAFEASTLAERSVGPSSLVLGGLALAGANGTADELGRVRGLVTAERLARLDLRACGLVVLLTESQGSDRGSQDPLAHAQGVRRLAQASLQAGARAVLVALWTAPEEPTRDVLTGFLQRLPIDADFIEGDPIAGDHRSRSLWAAKDRVRHSAPQRGRPSGVGDWAGWMLVE